MLDWSAALPGDASAVPFGERESHDAGLTRTVAQDQSHGAPLCEWKRDAALEQAVGEAADVILNVLRTAAVLIDIGAQPTCAEGAQVAYDALCPALADQLAYCMGDATCEAYRFIETALASRLEAGVSPRAFVIALGLLRRIAGFAAIGKLECECPTLVSLFHHGEDINVRGNACLLFAAVAMQGESCQRGTGKYSLIFWAQLLAEASCGGGSPTAMDVFDAGEELMKAASALRVGAYTLNADDVLAALFPNTVEDWGVWEGESRGATAMEGVVSTRMGSYAAGQGQDAGAAAALGELVHGVAELTGLTEELVVGIVGRVVDLEVATANDLVWLRERLMQQMTGE